MTDTCPRDTGQLRGFPMSTGHRPAQGGPDVQGHRARSGGCQWPEGSSEGTMMKNERQDCKPLVTLSAEPVGPPRRTGRGQEGASAFLT